MSSMMRFCSGVRLSAARADPVDAGLEASGKTAATSVKIPKDVADEMESVLKGLGELLASHEAARAADDRAGGCRSLSASPVRRNEGRQASRKALGAFSRQGASADAMQVENAHQKRATSSTASPMQIGGFAINDVHNERLAPSVHYAVLD